MSPAPASAERLRGGIDVGGTKISAALFTPDGSMSARTRIPIDKSSPDRPVAQILEAAAALADACPAGAPLEAVGICVPGAVVPEDGSVWAPNIPGWDHYPLLNKLRAASSLRFTVADDRAAYILGEHWRGAARDARNAVFLAIGTGIGAGLLVGGRVASGAHGVAGAVGWFALNPEFRPGYAERGCFETESSGDSVGRAAREALRAGAGDAMLRIAGGSIDAVSAAAVVDAAGRGDPAAVAILRNASDYIAMAVANIVSLLDPEVVVFGGGLMTGAPGILESVRRDFRRWAQPLAAGRVRLALSELGDDAGLFGAGRLAFDDGAADGPRGG